MFVFLLLFKNEPFVYHILVEHVVGGVFVGGTLVSTTLGLCCLKRFPIEGVNERRTSGVD